MSILKKYLGEVGKLMLENIMSLEINYPLCMEMEMCQNLLDEFYLVEDKETRGKLIVLHGFFIIGHIEFNVDNIYKTEIKFVPSDELKKRLKYS
jgi:uncharacterized membrane protein